MPFFPGRRPLRHHLSALLLAGPLVLGAADAPPHRWTDCAGSPALERCVATSGLKPLATIAVHLGDTVDQLNAKTSLPVEFDPSFVSDAPVTIDWEQDGRHFLFENVGGTGQAVLAMELDADVTKVTTMAFAWQNRPLTLAEALARARSLQAWLAAGGFAAPATTDAKPLDWQATATNLAGEKGPAALPLYTLVSGATRVEVSLADQRRKTLAAGAAATIFDGNGGYEWFLTVRVATAAPSAS